MVVTLAASWLVASRSAHRRLAGFWIFLVGNGLWIAWGLSATAYALVVLQAFLTVTNIRGILKCRTASRSREGRAEESGARRDAGDRMADPSGGR